MKRKTFSTLVAGALAACIMYPAVGTAMPAAAPASLVAPALDGAIVTDGTAQVEKAYYGRRFYRPYYRPYYRPFYRPYYRPFYRPLYRPYYRPYYRPFYRPYYRPFFRPRFLPFY